MNISIKKLATAFAGITFAFGLVGSAWGADPVTIQDAGGAGISVYEVSSGFYQNGTTYDNTTDFYITSKDGLKYFRDWVNGTSAAMNHYYDSGFLTLTLASFASNNGMSGKKVHLLADIDLTGEVWQPIGPNSGAVPDKFASNWKAHFYGSFYGHRHVVSNMDTSASDQGDKYSRWPQGFFGSISQGGPIDGLILENVKSVSTKSGGYAGGIVGDLGSSSYTISNCEVRGNVEVRASGYAGGICGIGACNVVNCVVDAEEGSVVAGGTFGGGLVGAMRAGSALAVTGNTVSGLAVSTSSSSRSGSLVGAMALGVAGACSVTDNDIVDCIVNGEAATLDNLFGPSTATTAMTYERNTVRTTVIVETGDLTPSEEITAATTDVTYIVPVTVKDRAGNVLSETAEQEISVSVGAEDVADITLTSVKIDDVVTNALASVGEDATSVSAIEIAVKATTEATGESSITYEVHPEAVVTVSKTGEEDVTSTIQISNDDLAEGETFTFNLDVTGLGVDVDGTVSVTHVSDGYPTETTLATVQAGDGGTKYVTVTTDHFSTWTLEGVTIGEDSVAVVFAADGTSTQYTTLAAATAAAYDLSGDVTVQLIANVAESATICQKAGQNLTVNGDGKTLTGQLIVLGMSSASDATRTETLTIKNFNFTGANSESAFGNGFVFFPNEGTASTYKPSGYTGSDSVHAHNVTISDCSFSATGNSDPSTAKAVAIKSLSTGLDSIKLKNIDASYVHSIQFFSVQEAELDGVTLANTKNGINFNFESAGVATIRNSSICPVEAEAYGIRIQGAGHGVINLLEGTVISAYSAFETGNTSTTTISSDGTINVKAGSYKGLYTTSKGNYDIVVTGGLFENDPSAYVAEGCKAVELTADSDEYAAGYRYTISEVPVIATVGAGGETKNYYDLHEALEAGKASGSLVTLVTDIDLTGVAWTPVGTSASPFSGNIDGNGKVISNLTVNDPSLDCAGLIGYGNGDQSNNYVIKDLTISNVTVTARSYLGALAGHIYAGYTISNVTVTGLVQISGNYMVGGVIGKSYVKVYDSAIIGDEGSFVTGLYLGAKNEVVGGVTLPDDFEGDNVGGFIGHLSEGTTLGLFNCSASGLTVMGSRKVGGLVGTTAPENHVENVSVSGVTVGTTATEEYATAKKSSMEIGGIVGSYYNSGTGGIISGTVEDVTIADLPAGVTGTGDGKNISYGLVTGGNRGANPESKVNYSALIAKGYDAAIYNNDYMINNYIVTVKAADGSFAGGYESLEDAVAAAQSGDTVTLLEYYVMTNALRFARKSVTLDLGGNTLKVTANQNNLAYGGVTTTIMNGVIDISGVGVTSGTTYIFDAGHSVVSGEGASSGNTINISDVTLTGKDYYGYSVFGLYNNCALNIENSTVGLTNCLYTSGGFVKSDSAGYNVPITIKNSTIDLVNTQRVTVDGDIAIIDSTIRAVDDRTIAGDTVAKLDNGFNQSGLAITNSTITVSGGTGRGVTLKGKDIVVSDGSTLAISDMSEGDIMFKTANTVTATDDSHVTADTVVLNGVTSLASELLIADSTSTVPTFVAQIGSVPYETFADAIAAAEEYYTANGSYPTITVLDTTAELTNPDWKIADGYLVRKVYVAQIGETKYESLAEAVAAASAGDTITMLADDNVSLTDGSRLTIDKSLTITGPVDTNGEPLYTIYGKSNATGTNNIYIDGSGTVTLSNLKIKDFGNNTGTDGSHAPVYVASSFTGTVNLDNLYISDFNRGGVFLYGGTFNVTDCYIDCANSRSGAFTKGVEIKGTATGTIADTVICNMERSSTTYSTAGIEVYGNGTITVDGCTIFSDVDPHQSVKGTYGIVSSRVGEHDPSGGSLHVTDCYIDVSNAALSVADDDEYGPVNNYSIVVDGEDTYFSNYIATWSAGSSITVTEGEFNEDVYADAGTINITGGTFNNFAPYTDTGTISISGGIFDKEVSEEYCAEGYIPAVYDEDTGLYTVKTGTYVAEVYDDNYDLVGKYETLAEAVTAASADDTIQLLTNVTGPFVLGKSASITLDLNGKTLSVESGNAISVTAGELTITSVVDDEGYATGGVAGAIAVSEGATLNIQGGIYAMDWDDCDIDGTITVSSVNSFYDWDPTEVEAASAVFTSPVPYEYCADGFIPGAYDDIYIDGEFYYYVKEGVFLWKITDADGKIAYSEDTPYAEDDEDWWEYDWFGEHEMNRNGFTMTLLHDVSADDDFSAYVSGLTYTVDLGGHTVNQQMGFGVGECHVTITNGVVSKADGTAISIANGAQVTLGNGLVIAQSTTGVYVEGGTEEGAYSKLTVKNGAAINGTYGVLVFGSGSSNPVTEVVVEGGTITGTTYGISGNGTIEGDTDYSNTRIAILGGTVSGGEVGIYHPQAGALNVSGGAISGGTAVYAKSGTISVTGGELSANGASGQYDQSYAGSGPQQTGDALVLDSANYPGGVPMANITGGAFKSANANAVASYAGNGATDPVVGFVRGGIFSSNPSAYVATDCFVVSNTDAETAAAYPWAVQRRYAKDDEVVVVGDDDYPITQTEADFLNALLDKGGENYSRDAITDALADMSVEDFQEAALLNIDITKTYAKPVFSITAIKRNRTAGTVSVTVTLTRENKVAQPIRGTLILETSSDCVNWDGCQDVQLYDEHFSESDTAVITMPIAKNARIFKAKVVDPAEITSGTGE